MFLSGLIPVVAAFIGRIFSPIGMDECWAQRLLTGIIELSSGVSSLAPAANELSSSMAMAAFMLGWAGLSVHCQVLSFIGSSKLRFSSYIIGKFFHGIISAVLVFIFSKLLFKEKTVALVLASQVRQNASSGFLRNISICCVCALIVFLAMLFLSKKHTGKKG